MDDLKTRFRASLEKRDSEFITLLRVSPKAGEKAVSRIMGLEGKDNQLFLEVLFEIIDEILAERGIGKTQIYELAAGKLLEDFFGKTGEGKFLAEVSETIPEIEGQVVKILVEEMSAPEEMTEPIRAVWETKKAEWKEKQ